MTWLPSSFRSEYDRKVQSVLSTCDPAIEILDEAQLAHLPTPVQRYLHVTGFVGRPRVHSFRLSFRGRIRSAPGSRWMPFVADQVSRADDATRLFWLRASYLGVPMQVLHSMVGGHATMRVRALGAIPVVDASGPVLNRSEAVTQLNDLAILAPGALVEPRIHWEELDERSARAHYISGTAAVSAVLYFDREGWLRSFVSDDRARSSADGKSFTQLRFSTPVGAYRAFGPYRIAAHGEARWHLPEGPFTYGEFELLDVAYNVHAEAIDQVA